MSILKILYTKFFTKQKPYIEQLKDRGMTVGKNVDILDCILDANFPHLITIGDNTTLTGVRILTHDASTKKILGYSKIGRVTIGSNVFIGKGTIILPGTTIGDNVIIGAGSVVAKDIPGNSVAFGNPVRVAGTYEDYVAKQKEIFKTSKVYNTMWNEKTNEDIKRQCEEIGNSQIAYDL